MHYRADIDGLRAIAVGAVILFHAGSRTFSGGYIGVDVFFVISGFLITGLILEALDGGTFSLREFWLRRARRILPALFAMMAVSAVAFAFVFPPSYYRDFSDSLAAQAVFLSNVLFWSRSDYFAAAAETRPLLHTWSLSVEEQFYLVFPLLLVAAQIWLRRLRWLPVVLLAALSFFLALRAGTDDRAGGFYLFQTRAWELGLGALVAFAAAAPRRTRSDPRLDNALAVLGLAAIALAIIAFDRNTVFPSYNALLPCLGTAALIWSGREAPTTVGRLLSARPLVFVGLLSYSLYLWHWPLLVFARALSVGEPDATGKAIALAAACAIAWLSYRFVERPLRFNRRLFSNRRIAVGALAAVLAIVAVGMAGHQTSGFAGRFPETAETVTRSPRTQECFDVPHAHERPPEEVFCKIGAFQEGEPVDFVAFGDSHNLSLLPAYEALGRQRGLHGYFTGYRGCPPLLDVVPLRGDQKAKNCRALNASVFEFVKARGIKTVILAARWTYYTDYAWDHTIQFLGERRSDRRSLERTREIFARQLAATVAAYRALGARVYLVEEIPHQPFNPYDLYWSARLFGWSGAELEAELRTQLITTDEYRERQAFVTGLFDRLPSIERAKPYRLLCGEGAYCEVTGDGRRLYVDDDHLSADGARYVAPSLQFIFDGMTPRRTGIATRP